MAIQHTASRRALLAGLATLPVIGIAAQAFTEGHPDAELLSAWNERQRLLAVIEERSSFYDSTWQSGREVRLFDEAEQRVHDLPAKSPAGVLAKLWVALDHTGGIVDTEEDRLQRDAIRRADLADVSTFAEDFDFGQHVLFNAIVGLTAIVEA